MQICGCWPDYNCYGLSYDELEAKGPNFIAYVGGRKLDGRFESMTEAKIAVERELGVSTMKQKVIQPEVIKPVRKPKRNMTFFERIMWENASLRKAVR